MEDWNRDENERFICLYGEFRADLNKETTYSKDFKSVSPKCWL